MHPVQVDAVSDVVADVNEWGRGQLTIHALRADPPCAGYADDRERALYLWTYRRALERLLSRWYTKPRPSPTVPDSVDDPPDDPDDLGVLEAEEEE